MQLIALLRVPRHARELVLRLGFLAGKYSTLLDASRAADVNEECPASAPILLTN